MRDRDKLRADLTAQRDAADRRHLTATIEMGILIHKYVEGSHDRSEEDSLASFSQQTDVPVEELRECLEAFRTTPHPYGYAWRQG